MEKTMRTGHSNWDRLAFRTNMEPNRHVSLRIARGASIFHRLGGETRNKISSMQSAVLSPQAPNALPTHLGADSASCARRARFATTQDR